jgi:hypothetical protein
VRTCGRCGRQLGTDDASCTACGLAADPPPTSMADLTRPLRPSQVLPAPHEPARPTAKDMQSGPVDLTQPARPQPTQAQPPAEFWADATPPPAAPARAIPPATPSGTLPPAPFQHVARPAAAGTHQAVPPLPPTAIQPSLPGSPLLRAVPPAPPNSAAATPPTVIQPTPPADFWHPAPTVLPAAPPAAKPGRPSRQQGTWQSLPVGQGGRHSHGRWLVFTVAAVVLLVAGGGTALAFAKFSHHDSPSRRDATGGQGPAGQHSTPNSSPASPSASAQPVALAPGVAAEPAAAAVRQLLDRYFTAINGHHFVAFRHLLSPDARHGMTLAHFAAGYGTTTDSSAVLRGISVTSTGQVAAHVTFTSHQAAAGSTTRSTCTSWNVTLYLDRDGSGLLVGLPPAGYSASYAACS